MNLFGALKEGQVGQSVVTRVVLYISHLVSWERKDLSGIFFGHIKDF